MKLCNKMERPRGKVLNTLTEIDLMLRIKVFVGNESFKTPPVGETSRTHCSDVIVAHSSTQTASVGLFYKL